MNSGIVPLAADKLVAAFAVASALACMAAEAAWPLQERIDDIAAKGGGTLTLTSGVYRTGALFFKPGVNLHLEKGATILGVDDAEGYPMRETRIEGETCVYYPALVNADGCDGFTISGEGVIDGHGLPTWKQFWAMYKANPGTLNKEPGLVRPRVLYVSNSRNVDVSGVTFKNSKFWTTHYYRCENVHVHDCEIVAEAMERRRVKGPSTDAIDIDACRGFVVSNVVMNVNDDAIAIKGGKGACADDKERHPENGPCEEILVVDSTFGSMCHSAVTVGSECIKVRDLVVRNCRVEGCGNLLNLKIRPDTPQCYSDILVEGCSGNCRTFFSMKPWKQFFDPKGRAPTDLMSHVRRVVMRGNTVQCKIPRAVKRDREVFDASDIDIESPSGRTDLLDPVDGTNMGGSK